LRGRRGYNTPTEREVGHNTPIEREAGHNTPTEREAGPQNKRVVVLLKTGFPGSLKSFPKFWRDLNCSEFCFKI